MDSTIANTNLSVMSQTNRTVLLILLLIISYIPCSYAGLDKECFSKLQIGGEVDLYGRYIGNKGAKEIAAILKQSSHITALRLGENNIGDAGIQFLVEALIAYPTLITLDLRENNIGGLGAQFLAELLITNRTLTALDLEGNNIGDVDIRILAESLKRNASLIILNLRFNNINDTGLNYLAEALTTNKVLITLDLEGNNIGDAGAQVLATTLMTNTALVALYLRLNDFGDVGRNCLLDALILNVNLQDVRIGSLSALQDRILALVFARNSLIAKIMPAIKRRIFHALQIEHAAPDAIPALIRQEFLEDLNRIKELQTQIYTLRGWPIINGLRKIERYLLSGISQQPATSSLQRSQMVEEMMAMPMPVVPVPLPPQNHTTTQVAIDAGGAGLFGNLGYYCVLQ